MTISDSLTSDLNNRFTSYTLTVFHIMHGHIIVVGQPAACESALYIRYNSERLNC